MKILLRFLWTHFHNDRFYYQETRKEGNIALTHGKGSFIGYKVLLSLPAVNLLRMIDNEVVSRIAQKIRKTRLEKNLTIQQLAQRCKVSKGLLSKVENSRTIPSLPVFITLIQSLEISLKEFFTDMILVNGKNYLLVKKENYVKMEREGRSGFHYHYIVSQNISTCTMEAVILTLEPGAKGKPTTTDGYEFKYMLSGHCQYQIDNETVTLEEGDSLYFDASVPHLPINPTRKKVTMLVVYFLVPKG